MKTLESDPQAVIASAVVSLVRHAADVHSTTSELSDVFDCISSGRWRVPVEKIRRAYQLAIANGSDPKDAVRDLKKALPGILFSGEFSRRANAGLITHSGLLCADLDDIAARLDDVRAKLRASPHVVAIFTSPTGTGLKAVFRVPADAQLHRASFDAVAAHVRALTDCEIDPACKDMARLCFVSHDPELFVNFDANELGTHSTPLSFTSVDLCPHRFPSVPICHTSHHVDALLEQLVPNAPGQSHRLLFALARRVKRLPTEMLHKIFDAWHQRASPHLSKPRDDYFFEFLEAVECVRYPEGEAVLESAWRRVNSVPLPEVPGIESDHVRRLVALCRELQIHAGQHPFFLPARVVQRLFRLEHPMVGWRWLTGLCRLGVLQKVRSGNAARRETNLYLFLQPTTKTLL